MKKYVCLIICFILLSFTTVIAEVAPKELPYVKIIIDNEQKVFTDIPILVKGSTLLPLRQILVYLGVPNDDQHIIWNSSEKSVTIKQGSTEIYLKVYSNKATVNGTEITLPAASTLYKGKTYIPVRFVAEALNKQVEWDSQYMAVYIGEKESYNEVKLMMDQVLAEIKNHKDISYSVKYDLDVKIGGVTEKHIGSDTVACDLVNDVTHFILGEQTGFTSIEATTPLAEEGYYTSDFSFMKYKGYQWSKSEFTDAAAYTYSSETGSKTPRSSKIVLNNLQGVVGDIHYAGLKINDALSKGNEIVLEGDIFTNYVFNKISSIIPAGKQGAQATIAMLFGGQLKSSEYNMSIVIDSNSHTLKKIEFTPQIIYEIPTEGNPLLITLSGKITHDYTSYNKGFSLKVPDEVVEDATNGVLQQEITGDDLITGRSASDDYEKINDLETLAEVVAILGQGKKTSSETENFYTWGNVGSGKYIEVSFVDQEVRGLGCTGNYLIDKYEKLDLDMTYTEVVGILGNGLKSKTEITDYYEWKYSDGKVIMVSVNNNQITGWSLY